jgi:hypothetical protein
MHSIVTESVRARSLAVFHGAAVTVGIRVRVGRWIIGCFDPALSACLPVSQVTQAGSACQAATSQPETRPPAWIMMPTYVKSLRRRLTRMGTKRGLMRLATPSSRSSVGKVGRAVTRFSRTQSMTVS